MKQYMHVKRYVNLLKYVSNWPAYFKFRHVKNPFEVLTFHTRNGLTLRVPRQIRGEFREVFLDQSYLIHMSRTFPRNPVVIDIGANVGLFSVFAAMVFHKPRIIAFEPVPQNFRLLKENCELNKDFAAIECYQKAVSGKRGTISIFHQAGEGFSTVASIMQTQQGRQEVVEVPSVTLADVFAEHSLEKCDLLKLDCEGAEYGILYNCPDNYLAKISEIAMEVHAGQKPDENIHALRTFLESKGFAIDQWQGNKLWAHNRRNRA